MMNSVSNGRVSLTGNDPEDPPAIDLNFLSHEYDVRSTIEAVRETVKLLQGTKISAQGLAVGPQKMSDESILVSSTGDVIH